MTRDDFECVVEDMLFHTRGMSRREQAGAVVNSVFWPELMKAIRERDEARELESLFNDALLKIVALTDTSMDPALSVKNINEIALVAIKAISEKFRKASAPPKRRKLGRDADGTPLNIIEPHCGQCAIDPRDGETWCVCGKPPVRLT
jgi:hypothetical protein